MECALEKIDEGTYGFSDVDFVLTAELDRLGRHRQVAKDIGNVVDAGVHVILTRDRIDTWHGLHHESIGGCEGD